MILREVNNGQMLSMNRQQNLLRSRINMTAYALDKSGPFGILVLLQCIRICISQPHHTESGLAIAILTSGSVLRTLDLSEAMVIWDCWLVKCRCLYSRVARGWRIRSRKSSAGALSSKVDNDATHHDCLPRPLHLPFVEPHRNLSSPS